MAYRTLDINLISASDLKNVNLVSKMDVYAVVSLAGDSSNHKQKVKTTVDRVGGSNPSWNFPIKFTVDETLAQQNRLLLVVNLKCERTLGDKEVGEVNVPVKELLDSTGNGGSMKFISYQVMKPSGKPKGMLNFSYKFGEKSVEATAPSAPPVVESKAEKPVNAYPATVAGSSYPPVAYPPPPTAYAYPQQAYSAYPPPPPAGYGYPPPPPPGYPYPAQAGYGYPPPPVQQPPKKNKFGLGLGAGLIGGALGGLLIGDLVSDAVAYDGGYDAGFCDGGF
ncbi:hypothetical protein SLEP1_g40197 [Rubroshorea leprosula]|uniref:C2 domain-containing protein n=1 Tax=Rubroshorea leprosula TaxID=152421 RepID=A0AAV5L3A6_9ROSI|nr:hypothetical protein SLEP1_g40197 [Rubroshorea leprosula]